MSDQVAVKDFTRKREPIVFALNGQTLRVKTALGLASVQKVLDLKGKLSGDVDKLSVFGEIFGILLHRDSIETFLDLMADEDDDPVGMDQLNEIMLWCLEKVGLRPTGPSPKSSVSSPAGGPGTTGEVGA